MAKKILASVMGGLGTLLGGIALVGLIGWTTNSGLLGICGPYGSDAAIWTMLALLGAGLVASPCVGLLAWRRIERQRKSPQAGSELA